MKTKFEFVELGEGHDGDYNPNDPDDEELLRLDYCEDGVEVESYCTRLPVTLSKTKRNAMLKMVRKTAKENPELSPEKIVSIYSWATPEWLLTGSPPHGILTLHGAKN